MALKNRFDFSGAIVFPKEDAKRPYYHEFTKDGKRMISMNFMVKDDKGYTGFVEAFDSERVEIKTRDNDLGEIIIPWEDRLNQENIDMVLYGNKYFVDLGEEFGGKKEFITQFDMMEYLHESLKTYNGKVLVKGDFELNHYNGKVYNKFKFKSVYGIDDSKVGKLMLTLDVFYNKNSVDKADLKKDQKLYLNGYLNQYINKDEGNKYLPINLVFNTAPYDMENDKHKARYNYRMKYIDTSKKTMVHIPWEVRLINGAEEKEFSEDMLTSSQKEQIDLGIKTLDDFKPAGSVYGERTTEFRIQDPILREFGKIDFSDGLFDTELTEKEFNEMIYVPVKDENLEDVLKNAENKEETEDKSNDVDDDDLF